MNYFDLIVAVAAWLQEYANRINRKTVRYLKPPVNLF